MRPFTWLNISLVTSILLTVAACTSTHQLSHSAVDPEWRGDPHQRILIVGLEVRKYRLPFEDTMAAELRGLGIAAIASYRDAPDPRQFDDVDEVERILKSSGADAVLTVRAEGFREANNDAWGAAYAATWFLVDDFQTRRDLRRAIAGGAAIDNMDAAHYGVEAEFWDAATYRSLWVGKTDTYDAGDLDEVVSVYADVVVAELQANGLIN